MTGALVGYARCSTDEQDLTAQRDRLTELGVAADRTCPDHGLTEPSAPGPASIRHSRRCEAAPSASCATSNPRSAPSSRPNSLGGTGDYTITDLFAVTGAGGISVGDEVTVRTWGPSEV